MRPTPPKTHEQPEASAAPNFAAVRLPAPAGTARLALSGELTLVSAARARAAIRRADDESHVLICDLGDVRSIDLTGLRVLLAAAAHAERTGGRLIIANAPSSLSYMLRLLRLDDALEIPTAPLRTPPARACAVSVHTSATAGAPAGARRACSATRSSRRQLAGRAGSK